MWGWTWLENLWRNVRYSLRQLRRSPGFTSVVVLTLALGIGANAVIFTLVNAVMLKALPVANPRQLYRLGDNNSCSVWVGTQNGGSFVLYCTHSMRTFATTRLNLTISPHSGPPCRI